MRRADQPHLGGFSDDLIVHYALAAAGQGEEWQAAWQYDKKQGEEWQEAQWQDDKRHGRGKCTWADGAVYEGEYTDGKKHGRGKYTWADGTVFEGEWKGDGSPGGGIGVPHSRTPPNTGNPLPLIVHYIFT